MSTTLVVFFILSLHGIYTANILLIPGPATSHCLEMMSIGEELLKRGHYVTLYSLVYESKKCVSKVNNEQYKSSFSIVAPSVDPSRQESREEFIQMISKYFFERKSSFLFIIKNLSSQIKSDCDIALRDTKLLKDLGKRKYDIALVQGVPFTGCFFAIPILLGVPAVAVSSYIDPQDSKMPLQTNIFPHIMTEFSNEMTFLQRLTNTLLFLMTSFFMNLMVPSVDLSQYDERLAGYDSNNLIKNSVLFLENTDYVVDYPKALFPNFVQVGGLTVSEASPLQPDLKKLMDEAKEGAVLVTFGSMLRAMPTDLKEKLMTTFTRLKHQVLFKQDRDEVHGNVKVLKWVPQNDILAHPNTKLFISHCGKNGFWEGVYHGVPIICMPINFEAHNTKAKVRKYGIGSSINIFDDTVVDLVETINGVLSNDSIYRNMKRISSLLRDRPETPRQRAASAIEHVIKYGGDHMRPPSVDFGFLSYTSFDVFITLFLIIHLILVFDIWLIRKCCCRREILKTKTE